MGAEPGPRDGAGAKEGGRQAEQRAAGSCYTEEPPFSCPTCDGVLSQGDPSPKLPAATCCLCSCPSLALESFHRPSIRGLAFFLEPAASLVPCSFWLASQSPSAQDCDVAQKRHTKLGKGVVRRQLEGDATGRSRCAGL